MARFEKVYRHLMEIAEPAPGAAPSVPQPPAENPGEGTPTSETPPAPPAPETPPKPTFPDIGKISSEDVLRVAVRVMDTVGINKAKKFGTDFSKWADGKDPEKTAGEVFKKLQDLLTIPDPEAETTASHTRSSSVEGTPSM